MSMPLFAYTLQTVSGDVRTSDLNAASFVASFDRYV